MTSTGARRRPQKYPDEVRERAVRMVFEVREQTGAGHLEELTSYQVPAQ